MLCAMSRRRMLGVIFQYVSRLARHSRQPETVQPEKVQPEPMHERVSQGLDSASEIAAQRSPAGPAHPPRKKMACQ